MTIGGNMTKSQSEIFYFVPYLQSNNVIAKLVLKLESNGYNLDYTNESATHPEQIFTHKHNGVAAIFMGTSVDTWTSVMGRYNSISVRFIEPYNRILATEIHDIIIHESVRIVANRFFTYTHRDDQKGLIASIKEKSPSVMPIDRYTLLSSMGLVSAYSAVSYIFSRFTKIDLIDLMTGAVCDRNSGTILMRVMNAFDGNKSLDEFIWKLLRL